MSLRRILLVLPLFLLVRTASAQTEDIGAWMTFSVNKGIVGKLDFNFDQELRFRNNLTDVNLLYTNLGLSYKFTKWFRFAAVYRFINKHKDDGSWGLRNRYYADFIFKFKPGKFTLGYRARFQEEIRGAGYTQENGKIPEIYMRNLFKFGYKVNDHFSPYVGTEMRWQIRNPRIPYNDGFTFDRTRFMAGVDYNINKIQTAGLYFLFQKEWNVNDPQTLYIIGLEYSLSFN
jgi:hypothetical protein